MSPVYGRQPSDAAYDTRLSGRDRRVLHDLCNHAGKDWTCRRKQAEIAKAIQSDRKGVNRSLKRLEELGYVAVVEAKGRSLRYRVIVGDNAGGQTDLFSGESRTRQSRPAPRARKSPAKRGYMAPSDVPSTAPSDEAATPTPIEQTSFNRGPIGPAAPHASAQADADREGAVPFHPGSGSNVVPLCVPDAVPIVADVDRDGAMLARRLREAAGSAVNSAHPGFLSLAEPYGWLAAGCDLEADILPTLAGVAARHVGSPVRTWRYFAGAVIEARDRRLAAARPSTGAPSPQRPARLKSVGDRVADYMGRIARGEDPFTDEETIDVAANR